MRHRDDKAKCNEVKEPEAVEEESSNVRLQKKMCVLKVHKLKTIISQCKVSISQCHLVPVHMEHDTHKKMLAQSLLELATISRNASEVMKFYNLRRTEVNPPLSDVLNSRSNTD